RAEGWMSARVEGPAQSEEARRVLIAACPAYGSDSSERREPIHRAPFSRLHGRQSIWQFSADVLPPFDQGVMWSAPISSIGKTISPSRLFGVRQRVLLKH